MFILIDLSDLYTAAESEAIPLCPLLFSKIRFLLRASIVEGRFPVKAR